jgi:hypothetical protein
MLKPAEEPEEPLVEIPIIHHREPKPKPPEQLVSHFRDRRFLVWLAVLLVVANILTPLLVATVLFKKQIVVVADAGGNMVIAPGLDFRQADKIHTTCAMLATQALLQRNPSGFDMPEMVSNLFVRAGKTQADEELKAAQPGLFRKSMHQKVEVESVNVTAVSKRADIQIYYIQVKGQVIRDGQIGGARVREVDQFAILLEMWRNPRLTENGRYPLVVADYHYEFITATGER